MQREPLSRGCRHRPAWNKLWTLFHPEFKAVKSDMRIKSISPLFLLVLPLGLAHAQGTVPTFRVTRRAGLLHSRRPRSGTGRHHHHPHGAGSRSRSRSRRRRGRRQALHHGRRGGCTARPPLARLLQIRLPARAARTQYADAMLRTTFPKADGWHTLLGKPEVKPVKITVPAGYGYILTSKKTGASFAVVDLEFLQKELFRQLPKQEGKLVIAVTHNTTYYADRRRHGVLLLGNARRRFRHRKLLRARLVSPRRARRRRRRRRAAAHPAARGVHQRSPARSAAPRPQRQGPGQHLPRLDASRLDAPGDRLRRHGRRHRPTSFSNPPTRTPRTISPHRRPLSPR